MKKLSFKGNLLLLSSITLVLSIGLATPQAFAAEGDVIAQYFCAGSGVGVAFDGTDVWWVDSSDTFNLKRCNAVTGVAGTPLAVVGMADPLSTISYDGTRNLFWAATMNLGGNMRDIYQIAPDGTATYIFTSNFPAIGTFTDGLAYDGEDDSLWLSGDVDDEIYHYATDGTLIAGPILIPKDPNNSCGNSGIAAGTGILYLGFNGCNIIQKHNKADLSLISSFVLNGAMRVEDLECDNITFAGQGIDVIWSKDFGDTDLIAFEVPQGTCPTGGGGIPVGGSIIPIDASALLIAGAFTNAIWIAPVLVGAAGTTAFYLKTRKN